MLNQLDTPKLNGSGRDSGINFEQKWKKSQINQPKLNLSNLVPASTTPATSPKSAINATNEVRCLSPSPIVQYKGAANFRIRAKMGEGAVGEVYQVVHKRTLEIFALKRVNKMTASMVSVSNICFQIILYDAFTIIALNPILSFNEQL